MKYLLDTGPLTAYLLGRQGAVALPDTLIRQGEAATSALVYAEAIEYFHSFPHFQQLQQGIRGILHHQVKLLYPTYGSVNTMRRCAAPCACCARLPVNQQGSLGTWIR
ncbi:MAG: hypothetical protein ACXVDF_24210 [Ktedonobacterales bacterium]